MRSLLLLLVLHSSAALCATLELEAFDHKQCIHWHMTSDTGGAESEHYAAALRTAKNRSGFSVFSAGGAAPSGYIEKFGACSYEDSAAKVKFYCLPNQDYPFAGAVYESKVTGFVNGALLLSCVSGCNAGVPTTVYEIDQDIVDEKVYEANEKARRAQFEKNCGIK